MRAGPLHALCVPRPTGFIDATQEMTETPSMTETLSMTEALSTHNHNRAAKHFDMLYRKISPHSARIPPVESVALERTDRFLSPHPLISHIMTDA